MQWHECCLNYGVMRYQRTIKESVGCKGVGLHSGVKVSMRLHPAPPDTGIIFIRSDNNTQLAARTENVVSTEFSSTLGSNDSSVRTVEHLLAAAAGLNIDNMYVELDAPEVPIMDGSALPLVQLMLQSGIVQQDKLRPHIKILDTIEINGGNGYIRIEPSPFPAITYIMDFDHPLLRKQEYLYHPSIDGFISEIAPARTFAFQKDILFLKERGLGQGGSLENAIILDSDGILNRDGLRFKDEFIRHKVLDLIGDLSLLSRSFIGHVTACRTGHTLNTRLASAILASSDKWIEAGNLSITKNT